MTNHPAPVELTSRPQWVGWQLVSRDGEPKPTKVPYNARSGRKASTTDPTTWSTFEDACAYCDREHMSGVGYVLAPDDPYVGVDLDGCRDPDSGRIEPWAKAIMNRLNSYTEISPSGTGLRIFIRGTLPAHGRRKGKIEIYSQARFLTITGDRILNMPNEIHAREAELEAWHLDVFGPPPAAKPALTAPRNPVAIGDAELLVKARSAANGEKLWALWNGDYSAYGSPSEADAALIRLLAYWTGPDQSRLDQLFRSSGLMRDKWDRENYRSHTFDFVLSDMAEFYDWTNPNPNGRLGATAGALALAPYAVPGQVTDLETGEIKESAWQSLGELIRATPEVHRQVVDGLIFAGRVHWVYSSPGVGKTIFLLAALMHVAAGRPFCGRAVEQCPIVLIEEDSPPSVISDYVAMLADIYGFDLDTLPFWINRQQGFRLTSLDSTNSIMDSLLLAPQWPGVVVIDACERVIPSDRFSSKELEPLSTLLQKLSAMNVASIVVDHTRKNNATGPETDPLDLLYGGRTKSAVSDIMIYFSGKVSQSARVKFTKFRGQEPGQFDVTFDSADGFTVRTQRRDLTDSERLVIRSLNDVPGQWLTKDELETKTGLSDRTLKRILSTLIADRFAERGEDARPARFRALSSGVNLTV